MEELTPEQTDKLGGSAKTEYMRGWRERKRQHYRDYQREYRRKYRAAKKAEKHGEN